MRSSPTRRQGNDTASSSSVSSTAAAAAAASPTINGMLCRFYSSPYNIANLKTEQKQTEPFHYQYHPHHHHQHHARISHLRPKTFPNEIMQSVPIFDYRSHSQEKLWLGVEPPPPATNDDDAKKLNGNKRVKFAMDEQPPLPTAAPPEVTSHPVTSLPVNSLPSAPRNRGRCKKRRSPNVDYHAYKRDEKTGRLPVIHEEKGVLPPIVEKYSERSKDLPGIQKQTTKLAQNGTTNKSERQNTTYAIKKGLG